MAIDTPAKRASVLGYTLTRTGPRPDGTVGASDRAAVSWLYSGLTYGTPAAGAVGGILFPPRPEDPRVVLFFTAQGITPTRGIDYEFRYALANDMGLTEAQALTVQVQDMWLLYKDLNNIDESAPFTFPL